MVKEIIFLIRKLMHGAEMYTKELNKKYSITSAQLNCLLALYENGPLPPSQIAKHMMVKSSTVTGVIDRLEKKGLVTRQRNSRAAVLAQAGEHDGLSLIHLPDYYGPDELGGMGVYGRWNVGNWCDETQALRHEIGL